MPQQIIMRGEFAMNSNERHKGRYERRVLQRKEKLIQRNKSFVNVFTLTNMRKGMLASIKGVRWKPSSQSYKANGIRNIRISQKELLMHKWKTKGSVKFCLWDRGKLRHIESVHISERVIQHTFCDELLSSVLNPTLIYDNCGSIKGKGMDFAIKRCTKLLATQIRKYGTDLFVLVFDFSNYFGNIDHPAAMQMIQRYITDESNVLFAKQLIDAFGEIGLGLGSQLSQNIAISVPNPIDHAIKEQGGMKAYIRYMDDGIIIHHSKEKLEECFLLIREMCEKLHITINEKKSKISHISKGFVFLKRRFKITKTGKIIKRVCKKTIVRGRRKVIKLFRLQAKGIIKLENIDNAIASIIGHLKLGNNYNARRNLKKLYKRKRKEAIECI